MLKLYGNYFYINYFIIPQRITLYWFLLLNFIDFNYNYNYNKLEKKKKKNKK